MLRVAAVFALLVATLGCSTIDSEDLETSGMTAAMEVRRGSDGSDVTVSLAAGTLNFVSLNNADGLTATAAGETVALTEGNLLNLVAYRGRLAAHDTGDEVTITLTRADKTSAPTSTVTLPATVEITSPAASAAFSRADDDIVVAITSEDSDDDLTLQWNGDCIKTGSIDVPADQASVTINKGTIEQKPQNDDSDPASAPVPDSCGMTITVERRVTGSLDGAYEGGSIAGVTSSSRDLTTNL